jgi:hypothetical protein
MYTQEEVEQMIDEATTENPSTAEGWLEHYNGNITRCAEALGVSVVTLRKHRDNGTLSNILVYSGKVYMYKNDVGAVSNTPLPPEAEAEWELIPPERANTVAKFNKQLNLVLKPNIKITRNPSTGRVQYWRKKNV